MSRLAALLPLLMAASAHGLGASWASLGVCLAAALALAHAVTAARRGSGALAEPLWNALDALAWVTGGGCVLLLLVLAAPFPPVVAPGWTVGFCGVVGAVAVGCILWLRPRPPGS